MWSALVSNQKALLCVVFNTGCLLKKTTQNSSKLTVRSVDVSPCVFSLFAPTSKYFYHNVFPYPPHPRMFFTAPCLADFWITQHSVENVIPRSFEMTFYYLEVLFLQIIVFVVSSGSSSVFRLVKDTQDVTGGYLNTNIIIPCLIHVLWAKAISQRWFPFAIYHNWVKLGFHNGIQ